MIIINFNIIYIYMGNIFKRFNPLKNTEFDLDDFKLVIGGSNKTINKRGMKKTHKRLRNLKQIKRTNKRIRKNKNPKHINKTTKRKY